MQQANAGRGVRAERAARAMVFYSFKVGSSYIEGAMSGKTQLNCLKDM